MVRSRRVDQVLVFTRTKRGANRLAEQLGKDGIEAAAIHGNKSQSQRVRALSAFKQGRSQVLVATDVAARGLDIESLPHVVNYELPNVPEDYVHRIGRTGRAGQEGTAISLVSADEQELMHGIEKLLKRPLEREVVEGFEPSAVFRPEPIIAAPTHNGRRRRKPTADTHGAPRKQDPSSHKPRSSRSQPHKAAPGSSGAQGWPGHKKHKASAGPRRAEPGSGHPSGRRRPNPGPAGQLSSMPGERISGGHPPDGRGQGRRRRRGGPHGPTRRDGSR